jgi:hypothetical protein
MTWDSESPRASLEHVNDSQKVNVFCTLSKEKVYGPFFFVKKTITSIMYLVMLQQFLIPHLDKDDQEGRIYFQQDGEPPHYLGEVREYLNTHFPDWWIGTDSTTTLFPGSYTRGFFLMEIYLKIECSYHICLQI